MIGSKKKRGKRQHYNQTFLTREVGTSSLAPPSVPDVVTETQSKRLPQPPPPPPPPPPPSLLVPESPLWLRQQLLHLMSEFIMS
ncbi:hypothetical protein N665_0106s0023 [Sinapis alba]|nr:hypothetical protein N665_0106s0023 [Sinapis alba]